MARKCLAENAPPLVKADQGSGNNLCFSQYFKLLRIEIHLVLHCFVFPVFLLLTLKSACVPISIQFGTGQDMILAEYAKLP